MTQLSELEYENARFEGLDLAEADLKQIRFLDCTFVRCNLSNAKPNHCRLQSVFFDSCKLTGMDFTKCDPWLFRVTFKNCLLNFGNFSSLKLAGTSFKGSVLRDAVFNESDLAKADFSECDLKGALFNKTDLRAANFLGARDYSISPLANKLQKARFDIPEVLSLLAFFEIKIG